MTCAWVLGTGIASTPKFMVRFLPILAVQKMKWQYVKLVTLAETARLAFC
jgi:hypothetical protein